MWPLVSLQNPSFLRPYLRAARKVRPPSGARARQGQKPTGVVAPPTHLFPPLPGRSCASPPEGPRSGHTPNKFRWLMFRRPYLRKLTVASGIFTKPIVPRTLFARHQTKFALPRVFLCVRARNLSKWSLFLIPNLRKLPPGQRDLKSLISQLPCQFVVYDAPVRFVFPTQRAKQHWTRGVREPKLHGAHHAEEHQRKGGEGAKGSRVPPRGQGAGARRPPRGHLPSTGERKRKERKETKDKEKRKEKGKKEKVMKERQEIKGNKRKQKKRKGDARQNGKARQGKKKKGRGGKR